MKLHSGSWTCEVVLRNFFAALFNGELISPAFRIYLYVCQKHKTKSCKFNVLPNFTCGNRSLVVPWSEIYTMTISHCFLHTVHCIVNTVCRTLQSAHCTQLTALSTEYCTLNTVHCTLNTAHCTLLSACFTMHTAIRKLHTTHHCTINWILYTSHCTLHSAYCTLTMFTAH